MSPSWPQSPIAVLTGVYLACLIFLIISSISEFGATHMVFWLAKRMILMINEFPLCTKFSFTF